MHRILPASALVLASLASPANASAPASSVVTVLPGCALPSTSTALTGDGCPVPAATGPTDAVACSAPTVDDRCEVVTDRYDGGETDMTAADLAGSELVVATDDGRLVLTLGASDADPTGGRRNALAVSAMDATSGAHAWDARYATAADTWSATLATDGARGFALGHDIDPEGCATGLRVIAFDVADGAGLWTSVLAPPSGSCIGFRASAIADGLRLLVGYDGIDENGDQLGHVVAMSAPTGTVLWTHEVLAADPIFNVGSSIGALGLAPNGNLLVAASGMGVLGVGGTYPKHLAWLLERFDPATGARTLAARWDVPRGATSNAPANPPAAVRSSPDGATTYLAGGVEMAAGASIDITVVAFDVAGTTRWVGSYDGPRSASPTNPVKKQASFDSVWFNGAMEIGPGGDVFVAGYSSSEVIAPGLWYDFVTLRFSPVDGSVVWARRYGSETYLNWIPSLHVTPDGETVVVNGQSRIDAVLYAARSTTIAYASNGTLRWIARQTEGHTFPQGLTLSTDGRRAYVAASSAALDGGYTPQLEYPEYDIVTLGYEI